MMRKITSCALIVALLAAVCLFSAQAAALPNPAAECESLDALNEMLGCHLQRPGVMGVSDEAYRIISTGDTFDIGEYCFSVNGLHYCYRFCADCENDISGVWLNGNTAFESQAGELEYASGEGKKLARWANTDGQYVLCVTDDGMMEQEQFDGIVNEIKLTSVAPEDETVVPFGSLPEGMYQDNYSGRATANVIALGDGSYDITISWADSALATGIWTMTASFAEDGLLYYTNCVSTYSEYDENGLEVVDTLCENGEGFFGFSENRLYWNGAADEQCRDCVFELVP